MWSPKPQCRGVDFLRSGAGGSCWRLTRLSSRTVSALASDHGYSADFRVLREGRPQWLALGEQSEPMPAEDASANTSNFIQITSTADLNEYRVWIQNWMSLLPYLNAGKRLIDAALANAVIGFLRKRSFVRSI
jgi:hypothetical protein